MRKAFILDTNVLLFDPQALFKFGNNDIVIPIVVLEEIDRFKREMSENGRHARMFSRLLDDMRKDGELSKGVRLPNGGILTVELGGGNPLPMELPMEKADNRMLALAISIKKDQPKRPVVFVTKDVNLRIKADALGISLDRISAVRHGSTTLVQEGFGSYSSRSIVMGGSAILGAAVKLQQAMRESAGRTFGCAPEKVVLTDGLASAPDGRTVQWTELAGAKGISAEDSFASRKRTYSYGAHAAHIAVDPGTLHTSVDGVFAVGDVRSGSVKRVGGAIGEGAQVVAALHAYLADELKPVK